MNRGIAAATTFLLCCRSILPTLGALRHGSSTARCVATVVADGWTASGGPMAHTAGWSCRLGGCPSRPKARCIRARCIACRAALLGGTPLQRGAGGPWSASLPRNRRVTVLRRGGRTCLRSLCLYSSDEVRVAARGGLQEAIASWGTHRPRASARRMVARRTALWRAGGSLEARARRRCVGACISPGYGSWPGRCAVCCLGGWRRRGCRHLVSAVYQAVLRGEVPPSTFLVRCV